MSTEDITAYGAAPTATPETNRDAIIDAANASTNGTVYVPSGEYEVALESGGFNFYCIGVGYDTDPGISFTGDGPTDSILRMDPNPPRESNRLIRYNPNDDHGEVSITDLQIDGNYENLNYASGQTGFNIQFQGSGASNLTVDNVRSRGAWTNGLNIEAGTAPVVSNSDFIENGVGMGDTGNTGHGINASVGDPAVTISVDNCYWRNIDGSAIDHTSNAACELVVTNAYVEGVGAAFLKQNEGTGETRLTNMYVQPITTFIQNESAFSGRGLAYSITAESTGQGKIVVDNVRVEDSGWAIVDLAEATDFEVTGGGLVGVNIAAAGTADRNGVLYFSTQDGGTPSINSDAPISIDGASDITGILQIQSGTGTLSTINERNASASLGTTDGVTVTTFNTATAPHSQTGIPGPTDVGSTAITGSSTTTLAGGAGKQNSAGAGKQNSAGAGQ